MESEANIPITNSTGIAPSYGSWRQQSIEPALRTRQIRPSHRPGVRALELRHLPDDILIQILEHIVPFWASSRNHTRLVPEWTITDLREPLDTDMATRTFHILCQTSRRFNQVATPFMYRFIHITDANTLLKLWTTLRRLCPERAALIRHLLMGIRVDDFSVYSKCEVFVRDQQLPIFNNFFQRSKPRGPAPFVWANGLALVREDLRVAPAIPLLAQKVYFDVVGVSKQLLSLNMIAPNHNKIHQSTLFRDAACQVASPTYLQPTQYLQNLRCITIEIANCPRDYIFKYGVYTMPSLQRLTLVNAQFTWFLDIKPDPTSVTTVLQRARRLAVTRGIETTGLNIDLNLGLSLLNNLTHLAIHLPRHLTVRTPRPRQPRIPFLPPMSELNAQLRQHGHHIRALSLPWFLDQHAPAAWYLGGPGPVPLADRRLTTLPYLQNLVHLTTSTQLLFGTLVRLEAMLKPYDALARVGTVSDFLRALPDSLQRISLIEYWNDRERAPRPAHTPDDENEAPYDRPENLVLDAQHGEGDWMEARWRFEEALAGRSTAQELREAIRAPHDRALLGLVLALGRIWLAGGPLNRSFELWPQDGEFYAVFTHLVVMDPVEGVGGVLRQRLKWVDGRMKFEYSFVKRIFYRGLDAVVSRRRR